MDTLSPTRERIAQAAYGVDEPEVTQTAQRRAYIVRDIWSDLYRRDQITAEERDAGQKFAAHLELATVVAASPPAMASATRKARRSASYPATPRKRMPLAWSIT